jgi:2-iminoacetate synthase ThiH
MLADRWSTRRKYDPAAELHADVADPRSQAIVADAKRAYAAFAAEHRDAVDFHKPDSIVRAYADAERRGLFAQAERVREYFFGKDIHFYGVTYLWDMCTESCVYCPAAVENRKKARYKPLALDVDAAVRDVQYVMGDGHRHLCVLSGEDPVLHGPKVLAEFLAAFDQLGLEEIILNVEPPRDLSDFRLWREAAPNTPLQFRIFQETYDRATYARIHPETKHGRKHDYDNRYRAQLVAMQHGFDNYGLGVLFGNHALPITEIDGLVAHADFLRERTGKDPARVNLPSAKHLANIDVDVPFDLDMSAASDTKAAYRMSSELLYALARLALPQISIVSSERDSPDVLATLDKYATCTTLNVHPGVGDNIRFNEGVDFMVMHFEQAPSFSRDPRSMRLGYLARGFRPHLADITTRSALERDAVARTVNLHSL